MNKDFKGFIKRVITVVLVTVLAVTNLPVTYLQATATDGSFNLSVSKLLEANGRADLKLTWDEMKFLGKEDGTRYYIYRKDLQTGKWEVRGRYGDAIKVLNVYPDVAGSDQLKSWMDALNAVNENVNITVDKVKITDFNANPTSYLDAKQLNYDVVVFGFWDSNYGRDLSVDAMNVIDDFIDNDGGVIFGHDTMETSTKKPNFKKVVEAKTSMRASATPGSLWPNWIYSYKIKVEKQGSVTTYPCDINGMSLIIPYSHTVGQIPTNPDAVYMGFEKYTKEEVRPIDSNVDTVDQLADDKFEHYLNYFYKGTEDKQTAQHDVYLDYGGKKYNTNTYLTVEDNVAFIQCGHSSGKTNTAEQMVLANTIYALAKVFKGTTTKDQILDTVPPEKPTHSIQNDLISFASTDSGNSYEYRIVAIPMGVEESVRNSKDQILSVIDDKTALGVGDNIKFSNTVGVDVEGGLQQFRYTVDTVSSPTVQVDDTSVALDGSIPVPPNSTKDTYIHVAAYDKANNVSKIHSFNLWDYLEIYNVREKFFDIDTGVEFQSEILTPQLNNATYTANPEKTITISDLLTYEYVNSSPTTITVTSDESANLINHYYKVARYPLVTERYISIIKDGNGNVVEEKVIKSPITSYSKEGQVYMPKADVYNTESVIQEAGVDRYIYSNSTIDLTSGIMVSADESNNVITHYYDQLLTKKINVVEHIEYPEEDILIYPFDKDIVLKQGTNIDISLPILNNHNFSGYYTIGSQDVNTDGSNKIDVGSGADFINLTWLNEEPIYLHYIRKTGNATVKIVNSYTKLPITSFETPEWNVGENIIISGDYIEEATNGKDFRTYIDNSKLKGFISVPIVNEGSDNTLVIELTPREKTIIYYGIETFRKIIGTLTNIFSNEADLSFNENTNNESVISSGSAVTINTLEGALEPVIGDGGTTVGSYTELDRESYIYEEAKDNYNGIESSFNLIDKIFDGWAILEESKNFLVNFIDPTTTNYVGYYRDPKATETYTYEVNYLNAYDNGVLLGKQDTTTISVLDKPSIDVKEIKDLNINGNSVDFEASYVEIIHPVLGTKTFSFSEDYLSYFNQVDSDGNFITGNYIVNIYYKPYVTVTYIEEFLNADLDRVISTRRNTLRVLYDEVTPAICPRTKFEHEYLLYKIDGKEVDYTETYACILPDEYNKTVVATYRPIVYNLNIKAYAVTPMQDVKTFKNTRASRSNSYYVSYDFKNIPANDTVRISEPKFDGFNFQSLMGGEDLSITSANSIVSIKADPQKVLTSMLSKIIPSYTVTAIYAKPSIVTVNHIDSGTNSTFKKETITSVIGTTTNIPVYEDAKRQFSYASVDNNLSTSFSSGVITFKPTLGVQTVNVYYVDNLKYNLTVTSSIGGTASGTSTGNYFADENISVIAVPDDGYVFDTWEISGVSGLDNFSSTLSFTMPSNTVTLNAVFEALDDGTGDSNSIMSNNDNSTSVGEVIDNNDTTEDISNIDVDDLTEWEYIRLFKPYIQGYPDETMQPNENITRSEFVTIVYNLYGEDKELDMREAVQFTDVKAEDWFAKAVAFSAQNNYIYGYDDGSFRPNAPITREELAAIISRFVSHDSTIDAGSPFTDIKNSWAKGYIENLYSRNLIYGVTGTEFEPKADASRGEVVTLVNRITKRPKGYLEKRKYPDLAPSYWAYDDVMNAANGGVLYGQRSEK